MSNTAIVEISFGQSRYQSVVRGLRATDSDKIAIVGGTLGLFTGVSFVSLLEIAFWVIRGVNVRVYEWYKRVINRGGWSDEKRAYLDKV